MLYGCAYPAMTAELPYEGRGRPSTGRPRRGIEVARQFGHDRMMNIGTGSSRDGLSFSVPNSIG